MRALLRLLSTIWCLALGSAPSLAQRYTEELEDRYDDHSGLLGHALAKGIGKIIIWVVIPVVAYRFIRSFFAEQRMTDEEFYSKYPHLRSFGRGQKPGIIFYALMVFYGTALLFYWMLFAMPETLKALMN